MLGRHGYNMPGLKMADFRDQRGIYVLYGNYGPHYVGLARDRGIGDRLKDHLEDRHDGAWDRFSWFGFRRVLVSRDSSTQLSSLASPATLGSGDVSSVIADMEALLIKAMGLGQNWNDMNFPNGQEWAQVTRLDIENGMSERAGVNL